MVFMLYMVHIDGNVLLEQDIPLVGNGHMLVLQSLEAPEEEVI